ncbi:MAG: class I SAM-dependent rRNA methyltransferase [Leptolinea sp.]|nr:class I SAM-dependent rRNA methyltransferase [Leptolinea sp.]
MKTISKTPVVNICYPKTWDEYELLDSGGGRKLERYGPYTLIRPEAEAIWKTALPEKEWQKAAAEFLPSPEENGGHWNIRSYLPSAWNLHYRDLCFKVQLSGSRHIGVFPEQAVQWDWITSLTKKSNKPLKVLNLFGYSGLATIAAAHAGASVTHVDASRKAVTWAHENQDLSNLSDKPIRWIVDDAVKFIHRQARREEKFDGLILDPPKFGRGPKGEVWEFYKLLPDLLQACRDSLTPEPTFVALTAYAVKASSITLAQSLEQTMDGLNGKIIAGELALKEESAGRLLSTAVFALWSSLPVDID